MNIILGFWLDSAKYPDALADKEASLGTLVTGFHGLVGLLETQLGLAFPKVSENLRIAQWQELIGDLDTGKQPYSKSFRTDSWNTAKELLRRRDELILAGWDPMLHNEGSKWLRALAELELANKNKLSGFPDRVRTLLDKLQKENLDLSIRKLTIIDEDENLWDPWARELIAHLRAQGITIEKKPALNTDLTAEPNSDLSLLQSVLAGKTAPAEAKGDGSILFVCAEQEWDAADFLSNWLRENHSENTVLIKNEGSLMLDELLHRYGVAALGTNTPSKWRSVLQVLPLVIDTYWKPLRVERLMELLTLPTSPLPDKIRYKLANVLANEPGIGGNQWQEALDKGIKDLEDIWIEQGLDDRERKKRRKNLDAILELWLNHEYYDPNDGIPFEKIMHICQKVSTWAAGQYHLTGDAIFAEAIVLAEDVMAGLKSLGVERVTRLQVTRILESVLGEGARLEGYSQEAAKWEVVGHPGQIWDKADTILWWGFLKNKSGANIRIWTKDERQWLSENGVLLTDETVQRRREALAWQQAVFAAQKRLILFAPAKVRGEENPPHPLWDEIRFAIAADHATERKITFNASKIRTERSPQVCGTQWEREPLAVCQVADPVRMWNIPENTLNPRPEESATSFESLVGCPLQWTFKYGARIRPGSVLSLPNESIMLGNLGHTILERLIKEKNSWDEEEVRIRTGELFDELTPLMAAPLLEPQHAVKHNQTKRNLQKAIVQFFKVLNGAGITIQHTEIEMEKSWNDKVLFKGRMDLVGETPSGRKILFDAKWSSRPANYKKRLEEGSVQLSLYHWLLTDQEGEQLPVAYFILSSGDFFSSRDPEFPDDYHVEGPALTQVYEVVRQAVEDVWSHLYKGAVVATGIPAQEAGADEVAEQTYEPIIEPPCMFCDYRNLCGVGRVKE